MTQLLSPVRVAVAGIGGFAGCHHDALQILEREGMIKVVAACDPRLEHLSNDVEKFHFRSRGISISDDFERMIDQERSMIDLVVVASPSQFHTSMHEMCVGRKLLCYLEKPPALDPFELEKMIALDEVLPWATNVGFFFVHQDLRQNLRRRLLSGEFGKVLRATLLGFAARSTGYFERNNWAGKLMVKDELLLDSCFGNAMAHYVNALLFLLGSHEQDACARPSSLGAELYRAYDIESMDTIFADVELTNGVEFRTALSHACIEKYRILERIELEEAIVEIRGTNEIRITRKNGETEEVDSPPDTLEDNLRRHVAYLRGEVDRPAVTLRDCRGFVEFNAMLYTAAPRIHHIGESHLHSSPSSGAGFRSFSINGLDEAAKIFLKTGQFPSCSNHGWAAPGGRSDVSSIVGIRAATERHLGHVRTGFAAKCGGS